MGFELRAVVMDLAMKLAEGVLEAVRSAPLDALLAAPLGASSATKGRGRAREPSVTIARIAEILGQHPEGLRSERLRQELGTDRAGMVEQLQAALAQGVVTKHGARRGTTYVLASSVTSASSSTDSSTSSQTRVRSADIERLVGRLADVVGGRPEGIRSEMLRDELAVDRLTMTALIRIALARRLIRKRGALRATIYFPGRAGTAPRRTERTKKTTTSKTGSRPGVAPRTRAAEAPESIRTKTRRREAHVVLTESGAAAERGEAAPIPGPAEEERGAREVANE